MPQKPSLYLAADHAGHALKEKIKAKLSAKRQVSAWAGKQAASARRPANRLPTVDLSQDVLIAAAPS